MSDMLVKLYNLPPLEPAFKRAAKAGIAIRRALTPERVEALKRLSEAGFPDSWLSECEAAFSRQPVSCFLAVKEGKILGFSCYDTTLKGFFGPIGVLPDISGKGIGKALLLSCLHSMRAEGYGYAIIGWAGEPEFFAKSAGAVEIPDSEPGIYKGMLLH